MRNSRWLVIGLVGALAMATPAFGQPGKTLEKCQKEVSNRLGKYLVAKQKVLSNCLNKVTKEVIKSGDPVEDAAKSCGAQLRKLVNSAKPEKALDEKFKSKVSKKCDPAVNSKLGHTAAQVLDLVPPVISEGIEAKNLDAWCVHFDNDPNSVPDWADGSLDSVDEWIDCAFAIADCNAHQSIASLYPRALEWFEELDTALIALGPKYADSVTALNEVDAQIDVFDTNTPALNCGPGVDSCGDGIANGTDQCDGVDLDGASCSTLGFKAGTLACDPACYFDFSGCVAGAFPVTGQTVVYKTDDDGDVQAGAPLAFTDNGDGTISDTNSGLMWEKKSNDSSMHDNDNNFAWTDAFDLHIDNMNNYCDQTEITADPNTPCTSDADCTGVGSEQCGHAGYRDWRVPNRNELQTIINFGNRAPAAPAEFDNACAGSCTVLSCSCTDNDKHWTSTTYAASETESWYVDFLEGDTLYDGKFTTNPVRAVRGGGL